MTDSIEDSINTVVTSYNDLNNVLEQLKAGELFQELDLSQYVTKSDINQYVPKIDTSQYVTKNDASQYATKNDLSNYVPASELNQYVTNNELQNEINNYQIPLSPDSNNLLRKTNNGYVVELQAAPDVSVQYVSSSKGSDTTGDGSSGNPFRTIYKALSRIPDNTSVSIYLWYQDTFNFWDGPTPAYTGNEKWGDLLGFSWDVGHRSVSFNNWGAPSLSNLPAGVTDDSVIAESQPVIVFRYSTPPDTGQSQCPGFWLNNGTLKFTQVALRVLPDNLPSSSQPAWWSAPFSLQNGSVQLYGCDIHLATGVLCGADGSNGATGTFMANYYCWFDTTNGKALVDAVCGYTVNLSFWDAPGGNSIGVNGTDTGLKYRGTNPSVIENSDGFVRISKSSGSSPTYAGLKTQNNIRL